MLNFECKRKGMGVGQTLLEFELLPWLVDVFSVVNLGSTKIKRLTRDAHHFCRQVHGRNLHENKIHGI
jgi:hypothetical protein